MLDPKQKDQTTPQPSKADHSQLYGWGGLTVAALIFLGATWDTGLHRLAVGLLIALIVLLIFMALVEGFWWVAVKALRSMGLEVEG